MKIIEKYLFIYLVFINIIPQIANAQLPTWEWVKSAGGIPSNDFSNSIAVDKNGNSYITGSYGLAGITFGSITLVNTGSFFVAKYDALGNVIWAKNAFGNKYDNGKDIAVDDLGNVYITGCFHSDSITFGTITLHNGDNTGAADVFIVKYDNMGNALWAKSGSGIDHLDEGWGITVDGLRNCYVTGAFFSDSIRFENTSLINTSLMNTSGGINADIFIVKYDDNGNLIWAKNEGGNNDDIGTSIAVDAVGNSYITGQFSDTLTLGSTTLFNNNSYGFFVAKLDSLGNVVWAKCEGGGANALDLALDIALDVEGKVYITGHFYTDSITIGSTTLLNASNSLDADIFIVKYDPIGNVIWARSAGSKLIDISYGITVDRSGNPYITGLFQDSTIQFDSLTLFNNGGVSWEIFVAKYNSTGEVVWARNAGGTGLGEGMGIALDSNNNCLITGVFSNNCIFDSTTLGGNNDGDIFIAKLSKAFPAGIKERVFSESINIYPNPFSKQTIMQSDFLLKNVTFRIDNMFGENVKLIKNLSGQTFIIALDNLPIGVYLLHVIEGNQQIAVKKLIIID